MGRGWIAGIVTGAVLCAALAVPSGASPGMRQRTISARSGVTPQTTIVAPGVTPRTIKIGLHLPLTGAAPVASDSAEKGKDLYFRWLESEGRDIHGRDVEVVLRNDQHNPSTAVAVCKEMVEDNHVFMLVGFIGGDQMQACARYAASVDVPYVGPGTTTLVLNKLDNYFATTMVHPQTGRLLADFFIERLTARDRKNGSVIFDAPSWRQPRAALERTLEARRAELHYDRRVSRTAGVAEARTVAMELQANGIRNVFIHTTPTWFLQLIAAANEADYNPTWTSVGPDMALATVLSAGCRGGSSIDGTKLLSPYPSVAEADRFDSHFRDASRDRYPNKTPDDLMWHLWALDKVIAQMLRLAGEQPTRSRFINRVERADRIHTGVGPTLRYRPDDHFGARTSHLLTADCSDERWHTTRSFVHDF